MNYKLNLNQLILIPVVFLSSIMIAKAQRGTAIAGTVYDETHYKPIPNVKVETNSGHVTYTDSVGNYIITLLPKDSLWFNYKGRNTLKYASSIVKYTYQFNVSLKATSPLPDDKHWLSPVTVQANSYRLDSIRNRQEYAKIFNPDKGGFRLSQAAPGTFGVGVDVDALINSFKFAYNKRQEMYRRRIIEDEQYNYVSHRFTISLVRQLTNLSDTDRQIYMKEYRPNYFSLIYMNDLQLGQYIENTSKKYLEQKNRIYNDPFNENGSDQTIDFNS
ncbi:carboxypeptidase-like regulatory domain-containing protein [Rhizosphaericola mali]|uniref:Carboxypeptidase regulatory-like domain-containing protein n=1 Tax=Rhizosphaericola mali TaxID=2545455 RepID=A0A5P2G9G9_9BACT|nr:carboxypeptidase-like regulatory domain-containing protein [Rhizosphaericola mali]QES90370.1 carboxypeptidase regulatory-like domain-containing protein [Rhizosphaericola mali]